MNRVDKVNEASKADKVNKMEMKTIEDVREFFAGDEFATKCLGAKIDSFDFESGEAVVSMTLDNRHHNAQGFVMGGVFSLLQISRWHLRQTLTSNRVHLLIQAWILCVAQKGIFWWQKRGL